MLWNLGKLPNILERGSMVVWLCRGKRRVTVMDEDGCFNEHSARLEARRSDRERQLF